MNNTIGKLRIKVGTPPGVKREAELFRAELAAMTKQDQRVLEREIRQLSKEAQLYAVIIIDAWTRLGEALLSRGADLSTGGKQRKRRKVQRVQFSECFTTPERIFYKVEINRKRLPVGTRNMLPHRVTVNNLTSKDTLFELSHACTRLVTAKREDYNNGVWIIVNRLVGADGIPFHVDYRDMLPILADAYETSYFSTPVVAGIGQYRKPYLLNFDAYPHWLVAGTSGGGKSNALTSFICTWARFMDSDDLKLILIDLKYMEFRRYRNLPHLLMDVVVEGEKAVEVLADLQKILKARNEQFADGDVLSLSEWNETYPDKKLPRIVAIIDELAELMNFPNLQVRKAVRSILTSISNLGRAVGVEIIAATQVPTTKVIPREVTGNMTARLGARTATYVESTLIIGHGGLRDLAAVKGRMMYKVGPDEEVVQTPHIQKVDVIEALSIAYGHKAGVIYMEAEYPMLDPAGMICYVADHMDGSLAWKSLLERAKSFAVPGPQLKGMMQEIVAKGKVEANGRLFNVVRQGNSYHLVEAVIEREKSATDFTIDTEITLDRLRLVKSAPVLMLPAPGQTSSEGTPPPAVESNAEDIHPLLLTIEQVVDRFIRDWCIVSRNSEATASGLYTAYASFCNQLNVEFVSQKRFGQTLAGKGYKAKKGNRGIRMWIGLTLLPKHVADEADVA